MREAAIGGRSTLGELDAKRRERFAVDAGIGMRISKAGQGGALSYTSAGYPPPGQSPG
jgi:hypothetical protein